MDKLTDLQIESLFYTHLDNAINTDRILPEGYVLNKEASKRIGPGLWITVHSDDHDTHFHLQYDGRGIDARFSYPDMELTDYVHGEKNPFSSRELKNVGVTLRVYTGFVKKLQKAGCLTEEN